MLQHRATGSSTTLIAPFEENYDVIQRTYTNTVQRQVTSPILLWMTNLTTYIVEKFANARYGWQRNMRKIKYMILQQKGHKKDHFKTYP